MQEKYNIIVIVGNETYIHKKLTFEAMRDTNWNNELLRAIDQAEYDNKE